MNKVFFIYIHITHSSRLTVGDGASNWISFKVEAYLYVFPLKKGKNYNSIPVLAVLVSSLTNLEELSLWSVLAFPSPEIHRLGLCSDVMSRKKHNGFEGFTIL